MGQLPYSFIGTGTYTNPATVVAQNVALSDKPDWFFLKDLTNWGAQSTAANPIYAEWFSSMAQGSYLALGQPSSTTTGVTTYASQGTSGGFTFINTANPPTFSKVTNGTTIDKTTFVASTATTTGLAVGDYVRIINPVGMLQIGGMGFQITAISAGVSITLGYMATAVSAGLTIAANATAFTYQKYYPSLFYPREKFVAFITQATQAKVYFVSKNDFTPGEMVDFNIPLPYGMIPLTFLTGQSRGPARVLTVTNTATESSIVIDVDTSGMPAFTYPASASFVAGASPAVCFPAGSGIVPFNGSATVPQSPPGTNLVDAFDNRNQYFMNIGTSAVGVASANIQWFAFKADYYNLTNA